jgi:uncharacterized protein (DUF3084 family)
MSAATQLDGLEMKLRQLATKLKRQEVEHAAVVAENNRLRQELDKRRTGGQPPAEFQQTITHCIEEVDRCLDWLNRN